MTIYARIQDGVVAEKVHPQVAQESILQPDDQGNLVIVIEAGKVIPLTMLYTPEFIAELVPIAGADQVSIGDSFAGGVFGPPPAAPAAVPTQVTMRQARLALLAAGKLGDVNTAIAALPSPQKEAAQIEWDFAAVVERQSQIVQLLGLALGLDDAALDALFVQAAAL